MKKGVSFATGLSLLVMMLILNPAFTYPTEIRIGLLRFGLPSGFWMAPVDTGLQIIDPLNSQVLFSGRVGQIQVNSDDGHLQIFIDGQERLRSDHTLIFSPGGRQIRYLWFGTGTRDRRAYRGSIALVPGQGRMLAINLVHLEDYLRSVVPSEIGDHAPYAALQAQAIAARSYAFRNLGRHGTSGFDLCDGVHCQAYTGLQREFAGGSAAVQETAGMVLLHDGKPANTVYHAHCGGHLSSSHQVWGGAPVPYLISHPDSLQAGSAFCDWETHSRNARAAAKRPKASANGITRPPASTGVVHMGSGIVVTTTSPAESPVLFLRGEGPLEGLPSPSTVRGHRVGMCQDGAIGMGRKGYSMSGILAFYYPGTQLIRYQVQRMASTEYAQVRLLPPPEHRQPAPRPPARRPPAARLRQPQSPLRFTDPGARNVYRAAVSPAKAVKAAASEPRDGRKKPPDFRKWFWCNLQPIACSSVAPGSLFAPTKKSPGPGTSPGEKSKKVSTPSRKSKKKADKP